MPRPICSSTVITALAVFSSNCSFEKQPTEGSGTLDPNGNPIPAYDGGSANLDRAFITQDTSGTMGDACPSNSYTANNLPPDLLIVLDRSGSMAQNAMGGMCQGGCGPDSKWAQMTTAINQVVGQTETKVRWGLKFFASPGGNTCNVNALAEVPVGSMNAAAISAAIASNSPGTGTPTRAAELQAAAYLSTVTDPNPKYILLATDGQPTCGMGGGSTASDDAAAIEAVATVAAMGFPTFVIGIATNGMAETTLNTMAMNGGHPRTGMPQLYYPVSTSADLAAALAVIQGMVALPCQFQLGGVPSDLGAVSVSIGGQPVPMSDWMYGPGSRSIIFPETGTTCANLKNGTVKDVVINLPCGAVIIP